MRWLGRFGRFWYGFFVGDDWRLAAGAVFAIATVDWFVRAGHPAVWWLLPPAVVMTLGASLRHATRRPKSADPPGGRSAG